MNRVDERTRQLIVEYHKYQGDGDIHPIKEIRHPDGGSVVLVRLVNRAGEKLSCIDMIGHGKDGDYATELWGVERENEKQMIRDYLEL